MIVFIILIFLAFISFVLRIVFVLKNRDVFDIDYEKSKITDLFFNKLRAKSSAERSHASTVIMLNLLLYLGAVLIAMAGIVFFVYVYSFPK